MIDDKNTKRILWYETIGFLIVIVLSWLNELLGLPSLLFGASGHTNWHEAALESLVLLAVWSVVFWLTRRLLARLQYLEGFLRVCAWCRKIGHDDEWVTMEDYFNKRFDVKTSHGICEACEKKVFAEEKAEAGDRGSRSNPN